MLFDMLFHILSLNIHIIKPINHTKWWIIKVKHPLSDICRKKYTTHEEKKYNARDTHSSFVIDFFFCICHLGSFPIVVIATFHIHIETHTSNTFSLGLTTYQLNTPFSKKDLMYGRKKVQKVITFHQLPQFLLKKSNHQNSPLS